MNGAEYIARTLVAHDVRHVFLVPAILRRTLVEMERLGITRITTHSEHAAAYMADGYARVSRRPAVAMAQSVGAANLAAALQDAYLGHSPVIALTGRKAPIYQHRNAYQEVLHGTMYEAVTKYNVCVEAAEQLPFILPQLFREATSGTPGPVHADLMGLAGDVIEHQEVQAPVLDRVVYDRVPPCRPTAESLLVLEALRLIHAAERPIIVAGGGVIMSQAHAELLQLAETLNIPIATSCDGKGIIPESHPLSVGVVGSYSQQCSNQSVSEADLVLFIGSATGDQVTLDWTIPSSNTRVIQIDISASELGRNYPEALGLLGDARTVLAQMLAAITTIRQRPQWLARVCQHRQQWRNLILPHLQSEDMPIRPERLCDEIGRSLPADAIVFADTGYSCVWAASMIPILHSTQRFIRAAGSLGWAFPASLGGKLAAADRPVICFCGDGAFLYHISELETARRWGIRTVTVINNNHYFGQSIPALLNAYGSQKGDPHQVVRFEKTNFARIAEDFGCIGIRVEQPAEIAPALSASLDADRPVVIDVATNPHCHPPSVWRPRDR